MAPANQPISYGWAWQDQKTVKPKRKPVERRSPRGERESNLRPRRAQPYATAVSRMSGGVAGCVKKARKRHAVRKMKVGPS